MNLILFIAVVGGSACGAITLATSSWLGEWNSKGAARFARIYTYTVCGTILLLTILGAYFGGR